MKRLLFPKNKFARVAINAAFIAVWEKFIALITERTWERLDELEIFNKDSFLILIIEFLFLVLPILSFTYWIWWGKKLYENKD